MQKRFINADELLADAFRLGAAVYDSSYAPSFIVGVWRGGAPVGIAVQEFLQALGLETNHIAVRTSAYGAGIDQQQGAVQVHNLGYLREQLNDHDKILLVDDVFDTGQSMKALLAELASFSAAEIRIACPWLKPERNTAGFEPDYYLHSTDQWLVFPHEMIGLTDEELMQKNPELAQLIQSRRS